MSQVGGEEATAAALADVLRSRFDGDVSPTAHVEGRARLVGAVSERYGRRRRPLVRALIPVGVLGAMTAVGALVFAPRAALTYEATDLVSMGVDASTLAPRDEALPGAMRFSDGSKVTLAPRGRARVARTSWRGAEVALDHGKADVDVVHRRLGRWVIAAGPYHVRVTGTRFQVAWSQTTRTLDLSMRAGSVQVEGPGVQGTLVLREGDRLIADESAAKAVVSRVSDAPTPKAQPEPTAAPGEEPPRARSQATSPGRTTARRPSVSWAERVAAGEFDIVLREANARSIDDVLRSASLPELHALADAARYSGREELATRTLLTERRRFPTSQPATMAAFLLGRLAEDGGRADEAVTWYERYLAEAPRGAFAPEALGRRMLASKRDGARARELARLYLERFPQGPYAAVAKALIGER